MNILAVCAWLLASLARHPAQPMTCPGPVEPRLYLNVSIAGGYVFGSTYALTSPASVSYSDCWANPAPHDLWGQHAIITPNGYNNVAANESYSTAAGQWSGWLQAAGVPTWCYFGSLSAYAYEFDQQASSAAQCVPDPRCYLRLYVSGSGTVSGAALGRNGYDCDTQFTLSASPATGWHFDRWTGDVASTTTSVSLTLSTDMTVYAYFAEDPQQAPPPDPVPGGPVGGCETDCGSSWNPEPLVLDLNGDGVRTTGMDDRIWFDLDGNGARDRITWIDGMTLDGFLWVNLSGKRNCVENGSELFGIGTVLPDGTRATDGFQALSMYDAPEQGGNGDGFIDSNDDVWSKLRIWIDSNHDGVCQPTETGPIHRYGVEAISLSAVKTTYVDGNGNGHFLRGRYWRHIGGHLQFFDIDGITFQGEHH